MNQSFANLAKFTKSLHPKAQKKIATIRMAAENFAAAADGRWNRQQALVQRKNELQALIAQYRAEGMPEGNFADEIALLEQTTEQLADIANNKPTAPWPDAGDIMKWLSREQRRGAKLELFVPDVRLPKGKSALEALRDHRDSTVPLREVLKRTINAPLTVEEAEPRAIADIEKLAASGAPDFRPTMRLEEIGINAASQGSVRWPQTMVGEKFTGHGLAFCAWLHKDELIARAKKEIRAMSRNSALSVSDRKLRRADLERQILEAERIEEVLFEMATAAGDIVNRRRGMNLLAVLQLREVGAK